jgi:glycosyltransferase involved in cell wall biosynthesis
MSAPGVLIVSYHYLPRVTPGSLRVAAIARHLARDGWRVTILTSSAATPEDGIRVVATGTARSSGGTGAVRRRTRSLWKDVAIPDPHVTWIPALLRGASALLDEGAGVVFSSSPPHSTQLALSLLRRSRRFRWVADYRDPWTAPSRQPRRAASLALQAAMEARALSAADCVIANTAGNRDALLARFGLAKDRVRVVTNGFDDAMLDAAPEASDQADLTYVGEVYPGMMDRYVAAVAMMRERGGAVPTLATYGDIDPREWRRLEAAGLAASVERRGVVSHEDSLRAMRAARALLLLLPDRESWRTCVPSKLYPYLAARRPVLALVPEGDAASLVRHANAGEALTDPDAGATAAAISRFFERRRAEPDLEAGREELLRPYAYSRVAAEVGDVLARVAGEAP